MRNAECGMRNAEFYALPFVFPFLIFHFAFLISLPSHHIHDPKPAHDEADDSIEREERQSDF